MSALHNDTLQPGVFSGSTQTPASRPPASSRNLRAWKKVSFYKSGDPQFPGHRIVINSRTFKTFDALLDALSKKVPLPFGVRTITTPKGTHTVLSLDDLQDGASYVCSDQRRVKPINLDEVNRRQVPWNTTRPTSSETQGRRGLIRQLVKKNEVVRTAKVLNRTVAVWTPKRLVVFKNRDPSNKRTIVLQKRTAPTFEALLDYLSQVLQFPVVKLYTADGRRVEGLPALILCSGVVVAAGNEPFRLGNYNLQGPSQHSPSAISESIGPAKTQPLPQDKKITSGSRSRSRNFSLSSERYFVSQINKSLNGSLSGDNGQRTGSMHTENNQPLEPEEMEMSDFIPDMQEKDQFIMPSEDDIEKSFCVNQDGSMTVEMKVRLTLKQEEMIHWTTTLSRTCANSQQRAVCSQPGCSPFSNTYPADEAQRNGHESKEHNTSTEKFVEGGDPCGSATSETLEKPKPAFRRLPTPGPRRVRRKEASVENIKRVSQNEVQESTVGAYSYVERTAEGELTEGYCVVSRSSSSSTRPVPKPRKNSSGEAKHKTTHSSLRPSRTAEVLQLRNNGAEITETVMRIYESQGTYENYFPNTHVTGDKNLEFRSKTKERRNPDSTDSGPRSSSNDCDVDLTRRSTSSDSQNAKRNELLSLSSGRSSPTQKISNHLSSGKNSERQIGPESSKKGVVDLTRAKEKQTSKSTPNAKTTKTPKSVEGITSGTIVSEKKQKTSSLTDVRKSKSPEIQSHTGSEKKTVSTTDSYKPGKKAKKKSKEKWSGSQNNQSPNFNSGDQKDASEKNLNLDDATVQKSHKKANLPRGANCQPDVLRSPDVLPPPHFKMLAKPKSMNECKSKSPKVSREWSESVSMPVLQSTPSNVHQYVENWLKKIQPESVPYMDEMDPHVAETEASAKFWIGSGSPDSSEVRSEAETDSRVKECISIEDTGTERPVSRPPVQIRCEGEPVKTQRRRGFCKSMPSVRIHPAEQESRIRMNKSSEGLVPVQTGETSQSTSVAAGSGMKPVLQQLCLSIQSIRRTSSLSRLTSLEKEKSSSLPDFSSHVASVFGAPSKALLSFLSVMTLKDGVSSASSEDPLGYSGSYPEALQVMQSLEKIASMEDEEELKASLTSLQSATSSELKKSWRDFQERNDVEGSPPLSPRESEQEFALEVDSEGEDQDKEPHFGIKELMDELSMPEDLRREISSLVDAEPTNSDTAQLINAAPHVASTSEDATTRDRLLDQEGGFSEERASDGDNITRDEKAGVSEATASEETYLMESCSALLNKDLIMGKSHIAEKAQTVEDETSQTSLVKHELDEGEQAYEETSQAEPEEPDSTQTNIEVDEDQETVACMQFESEHVETELHSHTSETYRVDLVELSNVNGKLDSETEEVDKENHGNIDSDEHDKYELGDNQDTDFHRNADIPEEDYTINEEVNKAKEEEHHQAILNCESKSHESHNSEAENEKLAVESPDEQDGNISVEVESQPEALECSAGYADPNANNTNKTNNSSMEEQDDTENMDTVSKASDAESYHSSDADQDSVLTKTRTVSCISKGSEDKHGLQNLEEEDVLQKQVCSADENNEEAVEDKKSNALSSDEDFDAESNYSARSEQGGEHFDQDKNLSCKSHESEAEQELQTLKKEEVDEEKDEELDEHEDKQSSASQSDEDLDVEPNYPLMSDQKSEHSEQNKSGSWRSQESETKQEFQLLEDEAVAEEKDEHEDKQSTALDSDEDLRILDHKSKHSEQNLSGSCKSEESDAEQETLEEEKLAKESDEHEDKQSTTLDSDKDFDEESKYPVMSDQKSEHSEQSKSVSCQSQESEAEEEVVGKEKDKESDLHEDKRRDALDSDEDFDGESSYPPMSQQKSEENLSGSCKSQKSEDEQETLEEEELAEEKDKESDEHEEKQSTTLDSDKDFYVESNCPVMSDQRSEHSGSCQSQYSEAEEEEPAEQKDKELDVHMDKLSNALRSDEDFHGEPNCPVVLDQDGEHSEQNRSGSYNSQESEADQELQTLQEENVTEEKDEESDEHEEKQSTAFESDEDSDAEANYPVMSEQKSNHSEPNRSGSCKSQGSEVEQELQKSEEDKCEDKQSSALESDADFDKVPNCPAGLDEDVEHSYQNKQGSYKSQESEDEHDLQNLKENGIIEKQISFAADKQSNALDPDEDFDAEPHYPTVSDQDDKLFDHPQSGPEHRTKQESITEKQTSPAEDNEHVDKQSIALDTDKDVEAESNHSYLPDPETEHPVRREPLKSLDREDAEGCNCVSPMEISQELLDFVNFALLSSALTCTYDSKGHMRIKPDRCKIRDLALINNSVNSQHVQRRLPSPNTSDLSDYRPETSDSGGATSQASTDLFTDAGEEEEERLSIYQSLMKPSSKICKRRDKPLGNSSTKANSATKRTASPRLQSADSLGSFHDSIANGIMQEPAYSNTPSSFNEDSEPVQRAVFHSVANSDEGVLIDKGRWLLKENHLIRRSPPVPMGMYENTDTTSADTGQDNTSEDGPYPPCGSQHSPLAVISSSELEEMARPAIPKCTYFSMAHSSDSDPFLDNQSTNSSKRKGDNRKSRELRVSPVGESSKTWAKKNGSLPSFASVEFKLPDGKVHPEGGLASGAVQKTARPQSISSRTAQEEESVEDLNLRCGRHCPIL